jgi:hypothetical protein
MLEILPEWYSTAEKKLEDCIDDIIRKNHIDFGFAHDSQSIEYAKRTILMTLYNIWGKVDVEGRKRMEEFENDMKKIIKKEKLKEKKK